MNDKEYLKLALEEAKKSVSSGGFPAGAVIVNDGKIIANSGSIGSAENDPTGHSELTCIKNACENLKTVDLSGNILYASLEPCLMCFSASYWANISKIVYGCRKELVSKDYYEGTSNIQDINEINNRRIELIFIPDFEKESLGLIKIGNNLRKIKPIVEK